MPNTGMVGAGIAPPLIATPQNEQLALKSAVHYIYNPFRKISFLGALGIGRHFVGRDFNYYSEMERCQVYPIWNTKRFVPKQNDSISGNALGAEAQREELEKAAGVCAADLREDYGATYGLQVLTPLIGMDGPEAEIAAEIVKLVQPYAYPLDDPTHSKKETLLYDLQYEAPARIKGAKLTPDLAKKADEVRRLMLIGVRTAINTSRENRAELEKQITQSHMGRPGRSQASMLDGDCCWLLSLPVPTSVSQGPDTELRDAMMIMARGQVGGAPNANALMAMEEEYRGKLDELDELIAKARNRVRVLPKPQDDESEE